MTLVQAAKPEEPFLDMVLPRRIRRGPPCRATQSNWQEAKMQVRTRGFGSGGQEPWRRRPPPASCEGVSPRNPAALMADAVRCGEDACATLSIVLGVSGYCRRFSHVRVRVIHNHILLHVAQQDA